MFETSSFVWLRYDYELYSLTCNAEEKRTAETAENSLQEAGFADNVKEENHIVPAVEDKDFHEKVPGLASDEGNQIVPAVEDTNFHEKITGLASGEGNQIPAVEDMNFHEKVTGLSSDEGNQTGPAIEDKDVHEKVTWLVSDDRHEAGDPCIDHQTSDGIGK